MPSQPWKRNSGSGEPRAAANFDATVASLSRLFDDYASKRVCVVGTTCAGKSRLVAALPGSRDQDKEIFPTLSAEESAYVCQDPWTPEIGYTMTRLVRERVKTEAGRPLFGTVVVESDLIVVLRITPEELVARCSKRGVDPQNAMRMQEQLLSEVAAAGVPTITIDIG